MGISNGAIMHRILGILTATMLACMSGEAAAGTTGGDHATVTAIDISALLAAANGAPPAICALAAQSVRNGGWGDRSDAPYTPLGEAQSFRSGDDDYRGRNGLQFSDADNERLLAGLASADPCVRELSVRIVTAQRNNEAVNTALLSRLGSSDAGMRQVAAFSLGLMQPKSAIDPLISALRDATSSVRANAAWALGRIDNGRALAPLIALFRDADPKVREAGVVAVGRIDSSSSVAALMRVLQNDESPRVRRVAAWALGQKEAREAVDVLGTALGKEKDPRVREMIVWALGNSRGRSATASITNALSRDDDESVRETAAWALAELNDRTAVDALGAAAANDKSSRVRGTAAWGIGQLRGEGGKAPSGLMKVLRDNDDDVRLKAAWALGQIGDPASLDAIRDALKAEQSNEVRRALIRAMIKAGGRSEQALTELLGSSDATVREAAVRGLAGNNSFNPWPGPGRVPGRFHEDRRGRDDADAGGVRTASFVSAVAQRRG
jgi:FOG: HEAT repeat